MLYNNGTSTYNVSVNINQPDPGTREIVNPLSAFPVGHTFLTLEQHNADGTSIIRMLVSIRKTLLNQVMK